MPKFPPLLLFISLFGCSTHQEVDIADGVWHENGQLGQFTDSWSVCHHFRAVTSDLNWLIDIDVSSQRATFDGAEMVSLVSFAAVTDKQCAVSLYRDNDIVCEDADPIVIPAADGEGTLRQTKRNPDWESTFDLDVSNLTFQLGDSEIQIDRIKFSDVKYSNFCPG